MKKKRKKQNNVDSLFEKILTDKTVRRNLVQKSFEHFFPIYFHRYMQYATANFQKEIFEILENEAIKLAVIVAFRGSAKSTIITTAYVLWSILGVQERKFIVICGQTEQKARQYLLNIKNELLNNDMLKKDLGPFEEERNSLGNATALIIKKLNVKIMISSVEQSIRGMRHGEFRPDLIILDDIEDTNSVKTREGRDKVFNWLTSEIIPAGNKNTRIIAVGNLLHEDSVLKRLQMKIENGDMERMHGTYREYPIIDAHGNSMWPGKYPTMESIMEEKEKTMDDIAWYREYELKILSTAEQVVHPEWIHRYDNLPEGRPQTIAIGMDLAISERQSADYTAMVIGYIYGYGKNLKIYIQPHPINERLTFPAQVDRIKSLDAIHRQKCSRVKLYVEDVGYQKALVQILEQSKYDVESAPTRGSDKAARLRLATPMMKDARVFFPHEGCEELIEQLVGFGKEKYDDLADAFAHLVIKTIENNRSAGIVGTFERPTWLDNPSPIRKPGMFPMGNKPYADL
jgi:predicted phage terminase large subunit-like protein